MLDNVKEAVDELNATVLPAGVQVAPFYDRQHLVDTTLHTVSHSVLLGITLVVLVLLLFLGRPSMALLVALTIPFSLLFALVLMYLTNIPIGLLVHRGHRLRHHRRWRDHHGREHRPPARRRRRTAASGDARASAIVLHAALEVRALRVSSRC